MNRQIKPGPLAIQYTPTKVQITVNKPTGNRTITIERGQRPLATLWGEVQQVVKLLQMEPHLIIGSRLPEAPTGWAIWNAPRPLYGQQTWIGDFFHGVHYAATDPADTYSIGFEQENIKLDGWLIEFVTEAEAFEQIAAWPEINLYDLTDPEHRTWLLKLWRERQRG